MADNRRIRVAVDNDFPVVVAGLATMFGQHDDRVALVELHPVDGPPPDVVLKDAFAFNEDLAAYVARAAARVVVFAATGEEAAVRSALDQGAAGYVHKGVSVDELVAALVRVRDGEQVVALDGRADRPVGTVDWPGRAEGLTERESEVLSLICQGLSNQEVAQALYLSINSVKTYIRLLYRKIGAGSRSQAVIWGMRHGFAPPGHG
jgi:DNA-binding NarL/FixJ family response regulator